MGSADMTQMFYLCINLGSLSSIATTEMEKNTGFWTAFLLCLLMFCVGIVVLIAGKKYYVVRPPKGSVIVLAFRAIVNIASEHLNIIKTDSASGLGL